MWLAPTLAPLKCWIAAAAGVSYQAKIIYSPSAGDENDTNPYPLLRCKLSRITLALTIRPTLDQLTTLGRGLIELTEENNSPRNSELMSGSRFW
jgi:hypothetical protein